MRFSQLLLGASAALTLAFLSGCGANKTYEPLVPTKFVSFGDSDSDLNPRYTIADGTVNTWPEQSAVLYGGTITSVVNGGGSYAKAGARVNAGSNSIASQITSYLSTGSIGDKDLILLGAGTSELIALAQQRQAGTIASDTALNDAAATAGQALAAQVRRLSNAGAKHVVVTNAYDLGLSPYAVANTQTAQLSAATRAFNDAFKIAMVDLGASVLLVDAESYFNLAYNNPTSYLGTGGVVSGSVCTSPNASTCTTSTLVASASTTYNLYLFSDDRHFTPNVTRAWAGTVHSKIVSRW